MQITNWIEKNWGISPETQVKLAVTIVVFAILWILRNLALQIVFRRIKDTKSRYYWRKSIKNSYFGLLALINAVIWIDKSNSIATFLGLVTAGLTIVLQVPIVNFVGWIFIMVRKPFEVGDRIEIGKIAGDVIDIRFFQFTVNEIKCRIEAEQSTGRIVHIPNGKVFSMPQANYTQGFGYIWNEVGVPITFESNWKKAKSILTDILHKHTENMSKDSQKRLLRASEKYMIFYKTLTPIVYTTVKGGAIILTMRFLCSPKKRRSTEQILWEATLDAFSQHNDITLYPTQRIYYSTRDEKSWIE